MTEKVIYKHYRVPEFAANFYNGNVPLAEVEAVSVRYRKNTHDFKPALRGGYTTCTISYSELGLEVTGKAVCSPGDAFCYAIGRFVAYDRALQALRSAENVLKLYEIVAPA